METIFTSKYDSLKVGNVLTAIANLGGAISRKGRIIKVFFIAGILILTSNTVLPQSGCSGYKTFTQGGWGANCNGGNPGCYRDNNFASAFSGGLTIGCNNTLTLTSAAAVNAFLPSGSSAASLPAGALVNPGSGYQNVLAAQIVALTLSVGFDAADPNFATATNNLGGLVIDTGLFAGMTVQDFLDEANRLIGGCGSIYTYAQVNAAATAINENFDNGTVDRGFLICDPLMVQIIIATNVACYGESNGSVSSTVTGGTPPYSYYWTVEENGVKQSTLIGLKSNPNGATTPNLDSLPAGTYTLLVSDANGDTASASATVTQPDPLAISFTQTNISCFGGNNGSATASVTGGNPPYAILWSNGETTETISNLTAGEYSVTAVCTKGCDTSGTVVITEPEELIATPAQSNVLCFGGTDGSASVSITGGVQPYTVLWSNGSTDTIISGVVAGSYSVAITDANGCSTGAEFTITEPDQLSASTTQTNVLCFGNSTGEAAVQISGGVQPYAVLWSNGSTDEAISGLVAGDYSATITDANGCSTSVSVTITEPTKLLASTEQTDVSCYGGSNGAATVIISGGVEPYGVLWSTSSTDLSISGLVAGDYSATVTDANACTVVVNITITQPDLLVMALTSTDAVCYGGNGTATAAVSGGTSPYTYNWVGYPNQTAATASLPVGSYTVIVTDANGCEVSGSTTINLLICDGFTTVTQGGFGAKCAGNNWGCYRDAKFAASFPTGLTVGACGKYLKLTSALAVDNFLPSGGTPRALATGTLTNPTSSSYKNTLAGQVVTLTLNVTFDANNATFAPATTLLGNQIIVSGPFAGWSVSMLLAEANKALGGCSSYSADVINNAVDAINRNYDGGTVNLGFLACPCPTIGNFLIASNPFKTTSTGSSSSSIINYPNPAGNFSTLEFMIDYNSVVNVSVFNTTGQLVLEVFNNQVGANQTNNLSFSTSTFGNGLYILKMTTDQQVISKQMMVFR